MSSNHSFESQPGGWQNLFSMNITKNTDPLADVSAMETTLNDISGEVHGDGVLKAIDDVSGNGTPMAVVVSVGGTGNNVSPIVTKIGDISTSLTDLKVEVDGAITDVLDKIGLIENDGTGSGYDAYGFERKLTKYKQLKRSNDTAIEKYNQQMDNHIVSLTTNMAILAGAVGIVYMSVKKN